MSIDWMKENGLTQVKPRSRRYPTQTITDADYVDDSVLHANTPAQAEFLLHSPQRAAGSIGLHVNTGKTEYMWFNQSGNISTLNGDYLKLGDRFTYFRSSILSTENDINMQLAKAYRSQTYLIKQNAIFFQAAVMSILLYGRWQSV